LVGISDRDHFAAHAQLRQLPVQHSTCRPGLEATLQLPDRPSLLMSFWTDSGRLGIVPRLRTSPPPASVTATARSSRRGHPILPSVF